MDFSTVHLKIAMVVKAMSEASTRILKDNKEYERAGNEGTAEYAFRYQGHVRKSGI